MRRPGVKAFLVSCVFWLIPGILAGVLTAFCYSLREYDYTVRLTEAVLEGKSIAAGLKYAGEKGGNADKESVSDENKIPETSGGAGEADQAAVDADAYLQSYGYGKLDRFPGHLPYALAAGIVLFEISGAILFFLRGRKDKRCRGRIEGLTEYLKAAGRGEAAALNRQEDMFSHLEDEIYKTVAELACTREEAVRDHEILAERTADIAHQLKTPLTSMSLMAELLEPSLGEEDKEYLNRLENQVERLKGLVEGLLTLAKLDSHTMVFHRQNVEAKELIELAAEPLRAMLRQKRVELACSIGGTKEQEIWLFADVQWTAEALLNILKNCLEHSPKDSKISVSCEENPLYTELIVEDGGRGFSKKDLPHLFERFYRGEEAADGSAGIGLALAKSIIEKQNGQVRAENSAQGHARFCIRWYHP